VALLIVLLAVYGLSYSGRFSTDDEHILASRSLSLAFQGRLNDDRVLGNNRIFTYQALPAELASQSLAIEPLQSLFGAGLARLALHLDNGRVQTLFLLNILAVAMTTLCVFAAVRVLGYPDRTALITALFFGLGTQAWVYTRTFFRDPLAMLFLTFAWTCALQLNRTTSKRSRLLAGTGILLGLALGILTKNTVTIALPVVAILLIPFWKSLRVNEKLPLRVRLVRPGVLLPVLIALAGLLVLLLAAQGPLARFSLTYYRQVLVLFITNPHPHFLPALFGPLVSPGKSLFLYSPVLLLSLAALPKKRIEALAAWVYVLLLVLAQALFYDDNWWGAVNWGLRFLVPALPLLAIATAGVIDQVLQLSKGWVWIALLGELSVLVQLIGISTPLGEYYRYISHAAGTLGVWDPRYSALVWTASRVISGDQWDLAALGNGLPGLLNAAGLVVLACVAFLRLRTRHAWLTPFLLICVCLAILLMPKIYKADPVYSPARSDFRAAQDDLLALAEPADGLVISSYGTPAWSYWMNWGSVSPAWVSLPYSTSDSPGLPASFEKILAEAASAYDRVWLLLPCDSPTSAALLTQKDQLAGLEWVSEQTYRDGSCSTYLVLFQPR
jgi:hypothetical protein